MRNLHHGFDRYYIGQIYIGDFAKNCSLLRIHKLYDKALKCFKIKFYTAGRILFQVEFLFQSEFYHMHFMKTKKNDVRSDKFCLPYLCPVRDIKNRILQLSNFRIQSAAKCLKVKKEA